MSHRRPLLRLAIAVATGAALVAGITPGLSASAAQPASQPAATVKAKNTGPQISTAALRFGVALPNGLAATKDLDAVGTLVGEKPSIVLSYLDFSQPAPIAGLDSVNARGAVNLLTWEPWNTAAGASQKGLTNAQIASGSQDAYIAKWGADLAKWGKPVYLRYGHEMNGNWYPWSDGVNGNAPGSYVAAYRHVHDVLVAQGATNVKWVWSPNIPYPGSTDLASLYPGSAYVDYVGLDGYNFGPTGGQKWTNPSDLFGPGLAQLRKLAPSKPIVIAETASSEKGGSKADWNRKLVSYLAAQKDVVGFVWFDFNKEQDWRIDSSKASADALKQALAARRMQR